MLESPKSSPTRTGEWMAKVELPDREWPPVRLIRISVEHFFGTLREAH